MLLNCETEQLQETLSPPCCVKRLGRVWELREAPLQPTIGLHLQVHLTFIVEKKKEKNDNNK